MKKNGKALFYNLQGNREKQLTKSTLGDLFRTTDIKKVFRKNDSTNWSYNLYTVTQVFHNIIPSCRINRLSAGYNENLLRSSIFGIEESNQVMKKVKLIQ